MVNGYGLWKRILGKCAMESTRFFHVTQGAQSNAGTPDSSGQLHARFDEFFCGYKLKGCGTCIPQPSSG
jgi:hypothetical protein